MKFMILGLFGLTALCSFVAGGHLGGVDTVVKLDRAPNGFWQKKLIWKPRWVKSWAPKTVYVAHWKKVWGPVQLKEWVPIPKPPPGWIKPHSNHVHHHHKVPVHVEAPAPYAPGHVDYIHQHRAPTFHPQKEVSIVNPEALHFHAAHGAHYGPAFGHHDHHHHHPNHHAVHHNDHHHHEHLVNPNAETFTPHFLPLSLDHLKIK